jgi:hypothetical protein
MKMEKVILQMLGQKKGADLHQLPNQKKGKKI